MRWEDSTYESVMHVGLYRLRVTDRGWSIENPHYGGSVSTILSGPVVGRANAKREGAKALVCLFHELTLEALNLAL